jgi:hypothetical protein
MGAVVVGFRWNIPLFSMSSDAVILMKRKMDKILYFDILFVGFFFVIVVISTSIEL